MDARARASANEHAPEATARMPGDRLCGARPVHYEEPDCELAWSCGQLPCPVAFSCASTAALSVDSCAALSFEPLPFVVPGVVVVDVVVAVVDADVLV